MSILVLIALLFVLLLSNTLKYKLVVIMTILWAIYTIYYIFKLRREKDKKEVVTTVTNYPPNNNYSPYIRYLYSTKVDYKVFILTIIELILKGEIKLVRQNGNEYYLIDNDKHSNLEKNEAFVKKILFSNIGKKDTCPLNKILRVATENSGYFYDMYKEWINVFEFENAKNKYFKPVKRIVDNSLMYFVSSILLVVYNILFTKYVVVALIIFYVTSYLTIVVNNLKNREDDAKEEYIKWLEFKNYLKTNSLDELDISSLENYATYAYALDEYDNFLVALNKKYLKDEHVFDKSILLSIMNFRIFDEVEEVLRKSIKIARNKYVFLFKRNKGRKI